MASGTDSRLKMPGGDVGLYLGPAPDALKRAALGVLLTGRARASKAEVDSFLRFVDEQGLDLGTLWIAAQGGPTGEMLGAVLLVPSHGSTAMLFVGQASGWQDTAAIMRLIKACCDGPDASQACVIQSLLDPGQVVEAGMLERAGLRRLAKLIYMHRVIEPTEDNMPCPASLGGCQTPRIVTYSQQTHSDFAKAIEASYIDTLDCPGLVGMRQTDQIIAGHQAIGQFDPSNWLAYFDEQNRPIAVLLLAEVTQGGAHELVYLGVGPAYRSKGVGKVLVNYAIASSARQGGNRLYLAVDDRNDPAVRLYMSAGFRASARKVAYVMPRAR